VESLNKALIVVDMQKDLCWNERRKDKVAKVLPILIEAIELFSSTGNLVTYSWFSLPPDDEQFQRFGDTYCIEGTDGAEIIPELYPLRGPAFKKKKHSVFFDTELDQMLRAENVDELYFTGLQTQICIMTSMADASFRGYRAVAVRECVISSRDEVREQALSWIAKYVGDVLPLADVARLLSDEK
jgi:nicotinamidase-related amidase